MAERRKPSTAPGLPAGPQRITAVPAAGFRRAGRHWPGGERGSVVAPDELTAEQWQRVQAEPMLTVAPAD